MKSPGERLIHKLEPTLHTKPPIEHEQERRKRASEPTSLKPEEKLSAWMEVLEQTHLGHRDRPEVVERLKKYYYDRYVIKTQDIPESYFDTQKRLAREQGHGDIDISGEMRRQLAEVITADQRSTLDLWLDYFLSDDSKSFPMWAKYWAFTGMVKLSVYDKEKHDFGKRDKGTVASFPDLDREALAYVVDAIIKKAGQESIPAEVNDPEFKKLLQQAHFGKLYAYAIEKVTPAEKQDLLNTKGEWVKYPKGSDHMPLVKSLQGHGTGWCTAGESTARTQLDGGDFYVYYSQDNKGEAKIPRAAIRMEGESIAEVRGIAGSQNLDPYIGDVVQKKMTEFPDGKLYEKKAGDMKRLTGIEKKTKLGQDLSKDDLIFLYEIKSPIQGFGYERDPRIDEIRSQRNPKEDAPIVFECEPDEIAWKREDVNKNTKAYVGPLFPGVFKTLGHLEHVYTSFPEGKITRQTIEIGGQNEKQLEEALERAGFKISDYARHIMRQKEFTTAKKAEQTDLIRLRVGDLFGNNEVWTTDQIYAKAKELGLELCPAEVGPHLRLNYKDQPLGEWLFVGMKQIADPDGFPSVFDLGHGGDGLWLGRSWAIPTHGWSPAFEFVFRLRK